MPVTMDPFSRYTERARKVLEMALRESLLLGTNYVGTEHLLLALVREGEGIAAQVLAENGDLSKWRKAVVNTLAGNYEQGKKEAASEVNIAAGLAAGKKLADRFFADFPPKQSDPQRTVALKMAIESMGPNSTVTDASIVETAEAFYRFLSGGAA